MPDFVRQTVAKDNFPFIVLFAALLIFHIPIKTDFGDDLMFREAWNSGHVFAWIWEYWNTTSPRLIINFAHAALAGLPQILWKFLNVAIMILAAVSLSGLLDGLNAYGRRRNLNMVIVSSFLMYNLYEMSSSGWIASTVNYMWTAAFAMFALLSVKRAIASQKARWHEYPITAAAVIFAANHQQTCAILLAVYLSYTIYTIYAKRNLDAVIIMQFALCLTSLALIFSCPGNSLRYGFESARWFPGHENLLFFQKISLGISATMNYFVMMPNLIFIMLSLLIPVGIFAKYKSAAVRIVSLTPVTVNFIAVLYVFFDFFAANGTFKLRNPRDIFHSYGIIGMQDGMNFYLPHLFYVAMICAVSGCLYLLFRDRKKIAFTLSILLLGISSRVILGFSPTVFASSYRTFLFLNIAFIAAVALVYTDVVNFVKPKTLRYINTAMILAASVNFAVLPFGYQIVKPFFDRP